MGLGQGEGGGGALPEGRRSALILREVRRLWEASRMCEPLRISCATIFWSVRFTWANVVAGEVVHCGGQEQVVGKICEAGSPDLEHLMNLDSELAVISKAQRNKQEAYVELLDRVVNGEGVVGPSNSSGVGDALCRFVDHLVGDEVPLVTSRPVLLQFAEALGGLSDREVHKRVAQHALRCIQPRVVSFEEQVNKIRENLAKCHERDEEWSQAAVALAGIDLESGPRAGDARHKLETLVHISQLYLEDDDAVNAETYIKRASFLQGVGGAGAPATAVDLTFKTCYARIQDSKRRFQEAALKYYELSQLDPDTDYGGGRVAEEETLIALRCAIVCAILAGAGPQRARILGMLCNDERCRTKVSDLYPILEKVYLERILRPDEVSAFAEQLQPHHKARLGDGSTVLDKAVVEHNMLACSALYNNIHCQELGTLLGIHASKAERIAARMIAEGRLRGSIDQVEGFIEFSDTGVSAAQNHWDAQISSICTDADSILTMARQRGYA